MELSFQYWYMFPISIVTATIAMFTAPGVLIGGQIGPRIQAKMHPDRMKFAISIIFIGVGSLMLWTLT